MLWLTVFKKCSLCQIAAASKNLRISEWSYTRTENHGYTRAEIIVIVRLSDSVTDIKLNFRSCKQKIFQLISGTKPYQFAHLTITAFCKDNHTSLVFFMILG